MFVREGEGVREPLRAYAGSKQAGSPLSDLRSRHRIQYDEFFQRTSGV